jgi:hypothetical protein
MIRSDLALGLDLAGLIVATFATLGAMTGIGNVPFDAFRWRAWAYLE